MSKRYLATLDIVLAVEEASKEAEKELATLLAKEGFTKGFSCWVIETDLGQKELVNHLENTIFPELKLSTKRTVYVKGHHLL